MATITRKKAVSRPDPDNGDSWQQPAGAQVPAPSPFMSPDELDDDLQNLNELLEKVSNLVPDVQKTVQEMIDNSNNADEDYFDRKEELNEQEEELNEIQEVLVVFRKNYSDF